VKFLVGFEATVEGRPISDFLKNKYMNTKRQETEISFPCILCSKTSNPGIFFCFDCIGHGQRPDEKDLQLLKTG